MFSGPNHELDLCYPPFLSTQYKVAVIFTAELFFKVDDLRIFCYLR
jgi:hypothetical protein